MLKALALSWENKTIQQQQQKQQKEGGKVAAGDRQKITQYTYKQRGERCFLFINVTFVNVGSTMLSKASHIHYIDRYIGNNIHL